ncbi:MAG: alpha-L-fucosidase [Candidatus Latescibacterota bacterium]
MRSVWRKLAAALFLAAVSASPALTQKQGDAGYKPAPENLQARAWFQDAKFGLFIHWGAYCLLEKGEWVMNQDKIPVAEYEKLPARFNPVRFDPDEWCRMVKDAGMKYITITSKHHDGFAMFDSKVSNYDIVDRTPYKKDVLKMLADACERNGVKLFFYHSQLDWHHPDYFPRGRTGQEYTGRPESGEWYKYLDYMDGQLRELCTNYGKIGGIWFDGMWDKPEADWRLGQTFKLIHQLQPQAMIGNNHHRAPYPGEDFQMFEKGLPGKDPFSKDKSVSAMIPLETCETMNNSWGYNAKDKNFKSTKDLVQYLVRAAGNNANFLLNVGPTPDGTIQPEFKQNLAEMGRWLRVNGGAIYGTRGGPVAPQSWGVTTQKKGTVYLHVLTDTDAVVAVPDFGKKVRAARLLSGAKVEFASIGLGTMVKLPEAGRDSYDTIVVLSVQ